jgi:hypothetical protein
MVKIASMCPNLVSLSFSGLTHLAELHSDLTLAPLCIRCPMLRVFDISRCDGLTDRFVWALKLSSAGSLTDLSLAYNPLLTDTCALHLFAKLDRLSRIDISGMLLEPPLPLPLPSRRIRPSSCMCCVELCRKGCTGMSALAVRYVSNFCTRLESLKMNGLQVPGCNGASR